MSRFSAILGELMKESGLSEEELLTQLMERGIYVERHQLKSWLKGKIPPYLTIVVLARIFSFALERKVTASELLGEVELKLREEPDGRVVIEIWQGKRYLGCIRSKGNGIQILSRYFKDRETVQKMINFSPTKIFIELGGEK